MKSYGFPLFSPEREIVIENVRSDRNTGTYALGGRSGFFTIYVPGGTSVAARYSGIVTNVIPPRTQETSYAAPLIEDEIHSMGILEILTDDSVLVQHVHVLSSLSVGDRVTDNVPIARVAGYCALIRDHFHVAFFDRKDGRPLDLLFRELQSTR